MIQPAKQRPWPRSQYYYWTQIMPTTTTCHNSYHSRPLWKRWYDYHLHLNWSKLASYKHINFGMTYTPIDKLTLWIPHLPITKLMPISTWHCRKALMHLRSSPDSIKQWTASINQATKIYNEGNRMEAIWVPSYFTKVMGIPTTSRYHCRKTSHRDRTRGLPGAQPDTATAWNVYRTAFRKDQDIMAEQHTERNAEPPYRRPTKWLPTSQRIVYRDTHREVDREVYREVVPQSLPSRPRFSETPALLESASARRVSSGKKDQGEKITGKDHGRRYGKRIHQKAADLVQPRSRPEGHRNLFRITSLRSIYPSMPIADDYRYVWYHTKITDIVWSMPKHCTRAWKSTSALKYLVSITTLWDANMIDMPCTIDDHWWLRNMLAEKLSSMPSQERKLPAIPSHERKLYHHRRSIHGWIQGWI